MAPVTYSVLTSTLQAEATPWLPTKNETLMAVLNNKEINHNKWIQPTKTAKNPILILLTLEIKHKNSNWFDKLVEEDEECEEDKLLEKQKKEITESTK